MPPGEGAWARRPWNQHTPAHLAVKPSTCCPAGRLRRVQALRSGPRGHTACLLQQRTPQPAPRGEGPPRGRVLGAWRQCGFESRAQAHRKAWPLSVTQVGRSRCLRPTTARDPPAVRGNRAAASSGPRGPAWAGGRGQGRAAWQTPILLIKPTARDGQLEGRVKEPTGPGGDACPGAARGRPEPPPAPRLPRTISTCTPTGSTSVRASSVFPSKRVTANREAAGAQLARILNSL